MNYLQLYNQERYLFETVSHNFHQKGCLSAFDFFCIVIWKANRSKSKIASRLIKSDSKKRTNLNSIVQDLSMSLSKAPSHEERLKILIQDWKLRLPMATAILTVLYPSFFTIYDIRVCDQLGKHHKLQYTTVFSKLWTGYQMFVADVKNTAPQQLSLRNKDRWLWAKSFESDLLNGIKSQFK